MAKFGGFGGGANINNLMKQVQKAQKDMENMQKELENKEYTATAGGNAVTVVITGKKEIKSIKLDKEVVDPDDVEMLEDLLIVAVNNAIKMQEEDAVSGMSKITGGMNMPGMF